MLGKLQFTDADDAIHPSSGSSAVHCDRKGRSSIVLLAIYAVIVGLYLCSAASAKPSQSDVFRSIQDNVSESDGSTGKVLMLMGGGAGLLIVLAVFSQRQRRQSSPRALRNNGKLLKEIRKSVTLRSAELKNLKLVAEQTTTADGEPLSSPLVLLLCPSVLAKAARDPQSRADVKVINQVIRKAVKR